MRANHQPSAFSCIHRQLRAGFTLVELMVVVGIIGLLIAIVLPAVNAARVQARVAATAAAISVVETGVEAFRADHFMGGAYPESAAYAEGSPHDSECLPVSPHDNEPHYIGGANFVVWALAGADLLGTPGFRDLSPDPDCGRQWRDDTGNNGLYAIDPGTNKPVFPRSGPYIDIDKVNFPKQVGPSEFRIPAAVGDHTVSYSLCFLDAFDQLILYYRANPAYPHMVGYDDGIYNHADNVGFTGGLPYVPDLWMNLGAGPHPIAELGTWDEGTPPAQASPPQPPGSFAYQLYDPNVSAVWRPHRANSFVLLSAGPDGLFGTADDVANFEINK